ncbi:MAG: FmdE family protein [Acidimicrobiales bacterium]
MLDQETIDQIVQFHGHLCPGLAMGIRAAEVALAETGAHAVDEEVVAIVETDMCGVDAVQFLTGCTFGKGNLIHLDYGKNAYTFIRRADGKAVRVSGRPRSWDSADPDHEAVFARVHSGSATKADMARFWEIQKERSQAVLEQPLEDLYEVRHVDAEIPPAARVMASITCAGCGEPTMETRIHRLDGRELCVPCFEAGLRGEAPVVFSVAGGSGS